MRTYSSRDYAPLSARAIKRILAFDRAAGFGPEGTQPNRNRFYIFLTQRGSDVQVRTVAVKSSKRTEKPQIKEVSRASAEDPWIHVLDLGFAYCSGYFVDWSREGFGTSHDWNYMGRWESEAYAPKCSWKINAQVINIELLKHTRRFRWAAWESTHTHLLDYLKVFNEYPQIEFLSKVGLGELCTKSSLIKKLKSERTFRKFLGKHADVIRACRIDVPTILRAYTQQIPLSEAWKEQIARREFRGYGLPVSIPATKAIKYMAGRGLTRRDYTTYLHACQQLELNLADTKVSFPQQFERRRGIIQEEADAVKNRALNCQIAAQAKKFRRLENEGLNYRIILPRSVNDLMIEGREMANCLGCATYAARMARGDSLILFVREPRAPARPLWPWNTT